MERVHVTLDVAETELRIRKDDGGLPALQQGGHSLWGLGRLDDRRVCRGDRLCAGGVIHVSAPIIGVVGHWSNE